MKYTLAALAATTLAANAAVVTTSYGTVTGVRDTNQAGPMWGQSITPDQDASPAGPHGTLYLQNLSFQAADDGTRQTGTVYLHAYSTFTIDGTGAITSVGGFTAVSTTTVDLAAVGNNGTLSWDFSGSDAFNAATSYMFIASTQNTEVTIADTSSFVGSTYALDVNGADIGYNYAGGQAYRGNGSTSDWDLEFDATWDTVAVPEPSSTALLGLGGLALILRRRK